MAIGEYRRERYTSTAHGGARTIAWGAIIAGVILAIAVQLMFGLLGLGIGLVALPGSDQSAGAIASTAGIYSLVAALIGLFLGAFATARFAGLAGRVDAALHGLVTWALATLVVVAVLGGTASSVLGGAFGAVGASIGGLTSAAATLGSSDQGSELPDGITADLRSLAEGASPPATDGSAQDAGANGEGTAPAGPARMTAQNIATITAGLSESASDEERQAAVSTIQNVGNMSREAAQQRLANYQQTLDSVLRDARQAADDAARSVATAAFSAFIALVLGAITGILGCILGRSRKERFER